MKEFDKAFECINAINDDYFIFKYDLKNLKLKIYYDRENYESALSLIHSYRQFLRTNVLVNKERRLRYKNFINYLEKIIFFRLGKANIDMEFIRHKLKQTENTSFKEWLIDKIDNSLKTVNTSKYGLNRN